MLNYGHYSSDSWMATQFGKKVVAAEQERFDRCAGEAFGYFALQLGMPRLDLLRSCRIGSLAKVGRSACCAVRSDYSLLPFTTDSVDFVAVSHVLEFSDSPHGVLREIARVLRPGGKIALSMFNPRSLLGIRSSLDMTGEFPNRASMIPLSRLKDWLNLLDFSVEGGECSIYSNGGAKALRWMEHAGARWWPLAGAVIFIVACKQLPGLNILHPKWDLARNTRRLAALGRNGA